jgi:hypothetical protein
MDVDKNVFGDTRETNFARKLFLFSERTFQPCFYIGWMLSMYNFRWQVRSNLHSKLFKFHSWSDNQFWLKLNSLPDKKRTNYETMSIIIQEFLFSVGYD